MRPGAHVAVVSTGDGVGLTRAHVSVAAHPVHARIVGARAGACSAGCQGSQADEQGTNGEGTHPCGFVEDGGHRPAPLCFDWLCRPAETAS